MSQEHVHYRTCNLCEAMCGIAITVRDDKIQSIKGDADDPFSRGHICPKAVALKDLYEDPDRLRTPMEKRDGQWHPLDWDSALDKVAARLQAIQDRYGNDALGVYLGNPNVHNTGALLTSGPVLRALKTRNKFSATSVDQLPHHIVAWKLFGHQLRIPVPDIDHCDHFVIFGGNPLASNGSIMSVPDVKKRLQAVKDRGALVVLDPRRSETARLASSHHFVRPGSDVLVLLAMLQTLYAEDRVAPGATASLLDTDPASLADAFAPYTPEAVAPHTGLEAAAIRQLVHDFCEAKAPALYGRMGVSTQAFGALCQYLIMLFNILTGRLDAPGGMMFTRPAADILAQSGRGHMGRAHSRVRGLPEFNGEFPVATLAEEILTPGEGQIRAMLLMAGNPVLSTPNGAQLDKAFAGLEFMVSIDFYMNESNRHADIILPPVSPLEREHYDVIFHLLAVRNTAKYAPALFPRPADGRHDWEIMQGLVERLVPARGLAARASRLVSHRLLPPHRLLDILLRSGPYGSGFRPLGKGLNLRRLKAMPHGIDLGPLQPALPGALYHRDRRIHLEADFFLADLARVQAQFFDEAGKRQDMLLIGRRDIRSNNSWLHNSQRLVKGKERCVALMNPVDMKRIGLAHAGPIRVRSAAGELRIDAHPSPDMMPGVISIPHGWGHNKEDTSWKTAQAHAGVSVNDLTDPQQIDALSGNAALNGVPVSVERAEAAQAAA